MEILKCGRGLIVGWVFALAPVAVQGQGHVTCGADSAFAAMYAAHLQSMFRSQETRAAQVAWVQDSGACHSALRVDSSPPGSRIYVYSLTHAGGLRYGVLSVPPLETQASNSVCFYDAAWRRRGVCLGEVQ